MISQLLTLEGRPQVASSCLGPRDRPWNSWRECRGRHSWSSTNVKKQLKTKQKQKHLVYYLHLFAIIYCYCRMDASYRDHDVHTKLILQEAQWLASSNRAAQLKLQLRCCFAAHRSPNGLRHAILYEPGADLDDAKSPRRLRKKCVITSVFGISRGSKTWRMKKTHFSQTATQDNGLVGLVWAKSGLVQLNANHKTQSQETNEIRLSLSFLKVLLRNINNMM